jgi:hypothetical protein
MSYAGNVNFHLTCVGHDAVMWKPGLFCGMEYNNGGRGYLLNQTFGSVAYTR